MKSFVLSVALLLIPLASALAQPDKGGNGGKTPGQDFSNHVTRLDAFFSTTQAAKKAFPEVDAVKFKGWRTCLKINMLATRPIDRFGMPQDAVNWKDRCLIEVYRPAWEAIADLPDVKYAFVLHEMFGLMDIEIMKQPGGAQDYTHSSKITLFAQPVGGIIGLLDLDPDQMSRVQRFRVHCYYDQTLVQGPSAYSNYKRKPVADFVIRYDPDQSWYDQDLQLNDIGGIELLGQCNEPGSRKSLGIHDIDHVGPHLWFEDGSLWNRRKLTAWGANNGDPRRIRLQLRYTPELQSTYSDEDGPTPSWNGSLTPMKMHFPPCPKNAQCQGWLKEAGNGYAITCTTEAETESGFAPADASHLRVLDWILNRGYVLPKRKAHTDR
jgi:hypothetical protein